MDFIKTKIDQFIKDEIAQGNITVDFKKQEELIEMAIIFKALGHSAFDLSNESLAMITRNSSKWVEQEFKGIEVVPTELIPLRQEVLKISTNYFSPDQWLEFLYGFEPIKEYLSDNQKIRNREVMKDLSKKIIASFKDNTISASDIAFFREIFGRVQDDERGLIASNFMKEIYLIPPIETWNLNPQFRAQARKNYDLLEGALVLEPTASDKTFKRGNNNEV